MTVSWLQGILGKLGSGLLSFLVEGWHSFPSGIMGWGIPQTERGTEHSSTPATSVTSPGFLLKDVVNCTHSPESGWEGELLVPIKLAWAWPDVTGAHTHMPAKRWECQPFMGGQPGSGTLLGWGGGEHARLAQFISMHGWLSSSAFVGWRERETGRVRMSVQPGKGVRKMFLMCIRLCSQARGLCPASRHVAA